MDAIDLKREIKLLREKRSDLENEKNSLLDELEGLESKERALKQEINVVGAVHSLNHAERAPNNSSTGAGIVDSNFEKKFREINMKSDIKVLNQHIKAALQRLEAEALLWESSIHEHEKAAQSIEDECNQLPGHLLRNGQELEEELGALLEKKLAQKAEVAAELEQMKREKRNLGEELRLHKAQINTIDADVWVMSAAAMKAKARLGEEEIKIKELSEEQASLREEISKYYAESRGWVNEAFLMNSG
jgi:chromosome segregation ATPase